MIRRYLFTGVLTLLPLVVTVWLLKAIFDGLVNVFRGPISWISLYLGLPAPPYWELAILSALATLVLLLGVGLLMGNFVGRQALKLVDELMLHIPGVKSIYGTMKQLSRTIQGGQAGSFKEVLRVEWPHPGSYTLGFLAHTDCSWAVDDGEERVAVYIPTAPNPTSGYVVMVPRSRVVRLDLGPEQALAWAISGGVLAPPGGNTRP